MRPLYVFAFAALFLVGCGSPRPSTVVKISTPTLGPAVPTPLPTSATTTTSTDVQSEVFVTGNAPGIPALTGKVTKTASGLGILEDIPGDGAFPKDGQTVSVHYTGWLTNGSKFDSSVDHGQPFSFKLGQGQVIKGWDEGITLIRPGGKARLIIPPELGYGANGSGSIPPNSTLIFDVQVIAISN